MDPRALARLIAAGRIAFGVGLLVVPEQLTRPWVGRDAARPGANVLARGLGGRDVALGLGALLSGEGSRRGWLTAGAAADAADLTATLLARDGIPRRGAISVSLLAASAVALGAIAASGH